MAERAAVEETASIGERLRDRRKELGLTLKDVADGAGLSVGFISQVERDLTVPSLSSLASISRVLRTPITSFLSQPDGGQPHTRHDQRPVYAVQANGLQYERLSARFPGNVLNSVIVHEPPGMRSEPIRHEGEEMFFVLKGEITVEVDDEATVLSAGDSIHFESTRCHSSWNHTTETVTILHVCTMDVFGDDLADDNRPGNRARHKVRQEPGNDSGTDNLTA
ncbi:MAG: cupin domain-containing protein [Brucellaceae bacterium]|nr:cupin domain-containing protein [Brucellaceae bacterium]MCO5060320.1 cupin domain-containing protein [Rhizobiaceae bacterium]